MALELRWRLTLLKKNMKHFTLQEFTRSATAAQLGINNTPTPQVTANLEALAQNVLDPLREAWGGPINVTSGYRCSALNRAVGGAARSQHLLGQAADVTVGTPAANLRLLALLRRLNLPVDQVINEHHGRWLHISHGPRNRRRYFSLN